MFVQGPICLLIEYESLNARADRIMDKERVGLSVQVWPPPTLPAELQCADSVPDVAEDIRWPVTQASPYCQEVVSIGFTQLDFVVWMRSMVLIWATARSDLGHALSLLYISWLLLAHSLTDQPPSTSASLLR